MASEIAFLGYVSPAKRAKVNETNKINKQILRESGGAEVWGCS